MCRSDSDRHGWWRQEVESLLESVTMHEGGFSALADLALGLRRT